MTTSASARTEEIMKEYERLHFNYAPYTFFTQARRYSSNVITTDNLGFRISEANSQQFLVEDILEYPAINIISGSSTVFGVGASSDAATLSSNLCNKSRQCWLNFGVRGANAHQENINLMTFAFNSVNKIKNLIVLSGINDIFLNLSAYQPHYFDSFYFMTDILRDLRKNEIKNKFARRKILLSKGLSLLTGKDMLDLLEQPAMSAFRPSLKPNSFDFSSRFDSQNATDKIIRSFERTFVLLSSLSKGFGIRTAFLLQPFFPWTGKTPHPKEDQRFRSAEEAEGNKGFTAIKDKLNDQLYAQIDEILHSLSAKYDVPYHDTNAWFADTGEDDDLFVRGIYMNDAGISFLTDKLSTSISSPSVK